MINSIRCELILCSSVDRPRQLFHRDLVFEQEILKRHSRPISGQGASVEHENSEFETKMQYGLDAFIADIPATVDPQFRQNVVGLTSSQAFQTCRENVLTFI